MTKERLIEIINTYEDGEDVNLNELARDMAEYERERLEELEERQHQSGFYAFQDLMDMRRREQ